MPKPLDLYYVDFEGVVAVVAESEQKAVEIARSLGAFEVAENVDPVSARKAAHFEGDWEQSAPFAGRDTDLGPWEGLTVAEILAKKKQDAEAAAIESDQDAKQEKLPL